MVLPIIIRRYTNNQITLTLTTTTTTTTLPPLLLPLLYLRLHGPQVPARVLI